VLLTVQKYWFINLGRYAGTPRGTKGVGVGDWQHLTFLGKVFQILGAATLNDLEEKFEAERGWWSRNCVEEHRSRSQRFIVVHHKGGKLVLSPLEALQVRRLLDVPWRWRTFTMGVLCDRGLLWWRTGIKIWTNLVSRFVALCCNEKKTIFAS